MEVIKTKVIGVNDLVLLPNASEDQIVSNLQQRYLADHIYTNIGPVLIALNPFKQIPGIYTDAIIRKYKGRNAFELAPHVYALADYALRNLKSYQESQCIVITGESGSGKTETSKIVMQYIAACTGKSADVLQVKEKMLASNPVLEAFGNAKTLRNDNSSRFGKYMKIEFNPRGDPVGGSISSYLLEKVRVVDPNPGERNFHIFYQVCAGIQEHTREKFQIYQPEHYRYLAQSNCLTVNGADDAKNFSETIHALNALGATKDQIGSLLGVISAILWLGNVSFSEDHQEQSYITDPNTIYLVAELLQLEANELIVALTSRTIETGVGARTERFVKPLTSNDAYITRDTLAKALYSKMFAYIVNMVNASLATEAASREQTLHIGLLDIYGFEVFKKNSFEQLCINFVNERLQQVFIEQTLRAEQEEYKTEGIPWQAVQFYDNKPCCEILEGKPGLFSILDDACNTSKDDSGFLSDLSSFFSGNNFIWSSNGREFVVAHFAGNVTYTVQNFTAKNKDQLFDDLIQCIQRSSGSFVKYHEWDKVEITKGQKKKPPTVGMIFKNQVVELMKELGRCTPHYCRCIKPNESKKPKDFDSSYTRNQVQYLGLVENVRVRQAGYAQKLAYDKFVSRYALICPTIWNGRKAGSLNDKQKATFAILNYIKWVKGEQFSLGRSKLFIRFANNVIDLEAQRDALINRAALIIQRAFKRFSNQRKSLENAWDCYTTLAQRKERRRASINRIHKGDYINLCLNLEVRDLFRDEGIIFADRTLDFGLKGKRGLLKRIKNALLKRPEVVRTNKFIVLTNSSLYCLSMTPPSDVTGSAQRMVVDWRLDLQSIASIIMSPYCDNVYIIESHAGVPVMQSCRRKTELVGLTIRQVQTITGTSPPLQILSSYTMPVLYKNRKSTLLISFSRTPDQGYEEQLYIDNNRIEVRVGAGIPGAQFTPPAKPREIDRTVEVRDRIQALYDYAGNGIDELTFTAGDIMYLISNEDDGWMKAELNGQKGFVPTNYVQAIGRNSKAPGQSKPEIGQTSSQEDHFRNNIIPVNNESASAYQREIPANKHVAYKSNKQPTSGYAVQDSEVSGPISKPMNSNANFRTNDQQGLYSDDNGSRTKQSRPAMVPLRPQSANVAQHDHHESDHQYGVRQNGSPDKGNRIQNPKPQGLEKTGKAIGQRTQQMSRDTTDKQMALPTRHNDAKSQSTQRETRLLGKGNFAQSNQHVVSSANTHSKNQHHNEDESQQDAKWQPYFDDASNAYYWYNSETGESSWEKPQ